MTSTNRKIELIIAFLYLLLNAAYHNKAVLIADIAVVVYLLIGKSRKEKLKSIGFTRPVNWLKTILICLFFGIVIEFQP